MYYDIEGLCPRDDISIGAHGFSITLYPPWRDQVEKSKLDQIKVDQMLNTMGRRWLDSCGYGALFDPDNCGPDADRSKPPGPNAGHLYEPSTSLLVRWGDWGPEHMTVPGNACGLDLDNSCMFSVVPGAKVLLPHNIDNWSQKNLLLIMFTYISVLLATSAG